MSDWGPEYSEVRAILREWLSEHVVQEQEERIKYPRGPAIHDARAKAHALAALALHRVLEGKDGV